VLSPDQLRLAFHIWAERSSRGHFTHGRSYPRGYERRGVPCSRLESYDVGARRVEGALKLPALTRGT